jgi:hypothetical protein
VDFFLSFSKQLMICRLSILSEMRDASRAGASLPASAPLQYHRHRIARQAIARFIDGDDAAVKWGQSGWICHKSSSSIAAHFIKCFCKPILRDSLP